MCFVREEEGPLGLFKLQFLKAASQQQSGMHQHLQFVSAWLVHCSVSAADPAHTAFCRQKNSEYQPI